MGGVVEVDFSTGDDDAWAEHLMDLSIQHHPAGSGVSEERRALLEAEKWSNRIEIAREAYGDALVCCKELGLTNATIAHAVGKSEAAVRMYVKRKKEQA